MLLFGRPCCPSHPAATAPLCAQIDFGRGPPDFTQINYQPRFDWWTIIQDARGYEDGKAGGGGVLCSLTLQTGLQDALVEHPAWRALVPEAHLILGGTAENRARAPRREQTHATQARVRRERSSEVDAADAMHLHSDPLLSSVQNSRLAVGGRRFTSSAAVPREIAPSAWRQPTPAERAVPVTEGAGRAAGAGDRSSWLRWLFEF